MSCDLLGNLVLETNITQAFVLGAGLGTRLRPLTDNLPKPLVPVGHRPLITWAFDRLMEQGVDHFMVNTHHCAGAYREAFPENFYRDCALHFCHEPILLETGGGIANVRELLQPGRGFWVFNGDILTDLPLAAASEHHRTSGAVLTMVLRSQGPSLQVAFDPQSGLVRDIRGTRGGADPFPLCQFTGIYLCSPEIFQWLEGKTKHSVIGPMLRLAEAGRLSGIVIDDGFWIDLGDRKSYLEGHWLLARSGERRVDDTAMIATSAEIDEVSFIGSRAVIGEQVMIERSVVWPGAKVSAGARIVDCVIRAGREARGQLSGVDW